VRTNALDILAPEIRALESHLGFPVTPDANGICARQLDDGMIVVLTLSSDCDSYGLHTQLLFTLGHEALIETLRLNLHLARDNAGVLGYADESESIVYTWNRQCGICFCTPRANHAADVVGRGKFVYPTDLYMQRDAGVFHV
jgi:hypothetical protein